MCFLRTFSGEVDTAQSTDQMFILTSLYAKCGGDRRPSKKSNPAAVFWGAVAVFWGADTVDVTSVTTVWNPEPSIRAVWLTCVQLHQYLVGSLILRLTVVSAMLSPWSSATQISEAKILMFQKTKIAWLYQEIFGGSAPNPLFGKSLNQPGHGEQAALPRPSRKIDVRIISACLHEIIFSRYGWPSPRSRVICSALHDTYGWTEKNQNPLPHPQTHPIIPDHPFTFLPSAKKCGWKKSWCDYWLKVEILDLSSISIEKIFWNTKSTCRRGRGHLEYLEGIPLTHRCDGQRLIANGMRGGGNATGHRTLYYYFVSNC